MAVKTSLTILVLLALTFTAAAQTPATGGVLANPEAPKPSPPVNPEGVPPFPAMISPAILMPGSGR